MNTRVRIVEIPRNHTILLFFHIKCIINTSFVNKISRVHEEGVKAMKTLVFKKYFLDINKREQLEKEIIEKNPELVEIVLEWDDEELLERINHNR
ncbi:hypothetical protein A6K24_20780 [Metabacillus litoralis]|uniref:Uncharacterized protein n=3 Tax=Metabacillus TaxID=2675233 RepID=A0A179SZS4_9BACI|nr:hypothetical protein A6K24_20780 [Metabacillus litoralis]